VATFTVTNGTGLDTTNDGIGDGIQFGSVFSTITAAGVLGLPIITPTNGNVFFLDAGSLVITGSGMGFAFPSTFSGTITDLSYSKILPVFTVSGLNVPLADVAGILLGGGSELTVLGTMFAGNDTIGGSIMADKLMGFDGNDTLHGGAGADNLDGGNGSDFANYQGSLLGVNVDLLAHTATGGDAQGDVLTNIENLYGSSNADHLTGDNGANTIGGELGDDTLVGNGGNDILAGEGGNDNLDGGDGADRLVGGDGIDTIHGGNDADSIDAGTGNDIVFGDAGNDSLYGGDGDDQLNGGDGNDVLISGAGADAMDGGAGTDTVSYAGSATGVTIGLAGTPGVGGDAQGDTLTGIENLYGSSFADHLTGDANANTISGGAGDDVITGGGGADVLKGGAGNDTFVYTAVSDSTVAAAGKDLIADFTSGDKIDLSAIDADGNAGNGDTAFSFGTGGFTGHAGEIRVVNFGNGVQGVYLDTNGDKVPESIINVISDHALTAADFVL
jgi:Ca2+-binding RTX toxin-like protein